MSTWVLWAVVAAIVFALVAVASFVVFIAVIDTIAAAEEDVMAEDLSDSGVPHASWYAPLRSSRQLEG